MLGSILDTGSTEVCQHSLARDPPSVSGQNNIIMFVTYILYWDLLVIYHQLQLDICSTTLSACSRFELRHADSDILQMLEGSVPPADVERVGIFLQPVKRYQSEVVVVFKNKVMFFSFMHVCRIT